MNKRIFSLIFVVIICVFSIVNVYAESDMPRLVDEANLLSASEESDILYQLDSISEKHQFDIVIYTVQSLNNQSAQSYADDLYDYNGYGFGPTNDGALLLIAIDEGEWYISTCGYGIDVFTDAGIEYIGDIIVNYLSNEEFYTAFDKYIDLCDEFVTKSNNGEAFDVDNLPKEPFNVFKSLLISLLIGLIVAFIATMVMKGQLKSVRFQGAASDYVKSGSMQVTQAKEFFLYSHIDRQKKVENNSGGSSTHTSSSGTSHGGGGGRF